jgi:hypothetical protein
MTGGLCNLCNKRPPRPGRVACGPCRDDRTEKEKLSRERSGGGPSRAKGTFALRSAAHETERKRTVGSTAVAAASKREINSDALTQKLRSGGQAGTEVDGEEAGSHSGHCDPRKRLRASMYAPVQGKVWTIACPLFAILSC